MKDQIRRPKKADALKALLNGSGSGKRSASDLPEPKYKSLRYRMDIKKLIAQLEDSEGILSLRRIPNSTCEYEFAIRSKPVILLKNDNPERATRIPPVYGFDDEPERRDTAELISSRIRELSKVPFASKLPLGNLEKSVKSVITRSLERVNAGQLRVVQCCIDPETFDIHIVDFPTSEMIERMISIGETVQFATLLASVGPEMWIYNRETHGSLLTMFSVLPFVRDAEGTAGLGFAVYTSHFLRAFKAAHPAMLGKILVHGTEQALDLKLTDTFSKHVPKGVPPKLVSEYLKIPNIRTAGNSQGD